MSTRQIPASRMTEVDVKDTPRRASDKHMEGRLVVLRTRRPRRRSLGRRPADQDPGRQGRAGRRRDPPPRQPVRLLPGRTRRRRRGRRLPHRQAALPGLPHRPGTRLAHRHRSNRRRLPAHRRRPPRHNRGPMGRGRRRSHPQAPRPHQQRRLRRILDLAPAARTPAHPPGPLPRHPHPRCLISSPERSAPYE